MTQIVERTTRLTVRIRGSGNELGYLLKFFSLWTKVGKYGHPRSRSRPDMGSLYSCSPASPSTTYPQGYFLFLSSSRDGTLRQETKVGNLRQCPSPPYVCLEDRRYKIDFSVTVSVYDYTLLTSPSFSCKYLAVWTLSDGDREGSLFVCVGDQIQVTNPKDSGRHLTQELTR